MAQKVVKATKEIIDSPETNKYQPDDLADSFKGKIVVLDPEKSEIAQNLKITKKGSFAVKL
jgi:RNA polymerase subunit RPABC4/transcription elongation factor Spt4